MRLILNNPHDFELDDFCPFVIDELKHCANVGIEYNQSLLELWDLYLAVVFPETSIKMLDVVKAYFDNQIFTKEKTDYIITVDKNIKIDNIPIELIALTIAQGTLDIKGYDVFSEIYDKIASDIDSILYRWGRL